MSPGICAIAFRNISASEAAPPWLRWTNRAASSGRSAATSRRAIAVAIRWATSRTSATASIAEMPAKPVDPAAGASARELQNVVPALAVRGSLDERVGFRRVAGAHVLVIPLELFSGPVGDVAEVVRFGRPTRVLEVGAGYRTLALGVVDPLDPVAGRARERFRRHLEVLEFLLGQELPRAEQHAVVADENARPAAPLRYPSRWLDIALVPDELYRRRTGCRRPELVSHAHRRGRELLVGDRNVGRVRFDR